MPAPRLKRPSLLLVLPGPCVSDRLALSLWLFLGSVVTLISVFWPDPAVLVTAALTVSVKVGCCQSSGFAFLLQSYVGYSQSFAFPNTL